MSSTVPVAKLIEKIVNAELDETQRELFSIEGKEIIDKLIQTRDKSSINSKNKFELDYGLVKEGTDIAKDSIAFLGVIMSFLSLYLQYRKNPNSKLKDGLEKIELEKLLLEKLKNENMPEDLSKKLAEKYHSQLLDLINEI